MAELLKLKQQRNEDLTEFIKRFAAAADVLEHIGVSIGVALITLSDKELKEQKISRNAASTTAREAAEKKCLNKLLASAFIQAADKSRYQQVVVNLENEFLKNNNQYDEDVTAAYNMLENRRPRRYTRITPRQPTASHFLRTA